ncbi:hypothetical protein SACC_32910 [Saccharolobus caldissimus]|uniref:Uncharacterized protein n=1 Tax=Saccharolobus caldissimus TaxID=1702097 RepID=A0AAQ4CWU3_9CREN|nr:hypothetical protein SACC_32910 [Saccharolobus caldissimus]
MKDEQKRKDRKDNKHNIRNSTNGNSDINADPFVDYISHILGQTKAPLRLRIFIKLYGIYWRLRMLVRKE